MIVSLIIYLYTFIIVFVFGKGFFSIIQKIFRQPQNNLSWSTTIILGLAVITTIASFASIFIRINWEFHVILLIAAILICVFSKSQFNLNLKFRIKQFNNYQKIGLLLAIIYVSIIFIQSTQIPTNADTGIYHAQTIHWIESFPAVPGLANLHERLGYNSSWLLLNAVFSFSFLGTQSFHLVSGFLFIVLAIYFYGGIHQLLEKKYTLQNFIRLGFFLSMILFLFDQISSPGTDAPATLFIWFLLTKYIDLSVKRMNDEEIVNAFVLLIISIYCITIKLSTVPVLLLPFSWLIYIFIKKYYSVLIFSIITMAIILLPFFTRNIIQTGYPVFPGFPFKIFNFDWSISPERVREESAVINWFATLNSVQLEDYLKMSLSDKYGNWFANQLPRHKAILLFIPFMLFLNLSALFFKKWRSYIKQNIWYFMTIVIFLIGDLFWLFSAPSFRFGYGFLVGSAFLLFFPALTFFIKENTRIKKIAPLLVLFFTVIGSVYSIHSSVNFKKLSESIFMPRDYPQWSSEPCQFKNFNILCQAGYDSCWYNPFPCAIRGNLDLEMRGSDIRDGFRFSK